MKIITSLVCLVIGMFLVGCDIDGSDSKSSSSSNPNIQSFDRMISGNIMKKGESDYVNLQINPNKIYGFYIETYNDGSADRISVYFNGEKIGSYVVPAKSMGGNGWYLKPYRSPIYKISTTNDFSGTNINATISVRIDSADEWGTWPKYVIGEEILGEDGAEALDLNYDYEQ